MPGNWFIIRSLPNANIYFYRFGLEHVLTTVFLKNVVTVAKTSAAVDNFIGLVCWPDEFRFRAKVIKIWFLIVKAKYAFVGDFAGLPMTVVESWCVPSWLLFVRALPMIVRIKPVRRLPKILNIDQKYKLMYFPSRSMSVFVRDKEVNRMVG